MYHGGYVYMLTNSQNKVLYTGVSSELLGRIQKHRTKEFANSFTAKYNCNKLVYFEGFHSIEEAIAREKQLKAWKREWKDALVNSFNPEWRDLSEELESM